AGKTPEDLDAARSLLAEHGAPETHENGHVPEWRLLVAPVAGTFRASGAAQGSTPGDHVRPGAVLGHIEVRSGQNPVAPGFAATVLEWLVEGGGPGAQGPPPVRPPPGAAAGPPPGGVLPGEQTTRPTGRRATYATDRRFPGLANPRVRRVSASERAHQ